MEKAGHLPNASTFCGKCESVCPVRIPLPKLMRHWREREFERHLNPAAVRANLAFWGVLRPPAGALSPGNPGGGGRHGAVRPQEGPLRQHADGRRLDRGTRPAGARGRHLLRPLRQGPAGGAGLMSKQSILTAIRRGLKRGPLPPDQAAMLRGRLAQHPRHLIPARSRLPHPQQVDLFVRNVEKEFGSVTRVRRPGRGARGGGGLSGGAEPARLGGHGAASGIAGNPLVGPPVAGYPRGPGARHRCGQRAARLRRHRRDRHADAAEFRPNGR